MKPLRVVVVEDDALMGMLLAELLAGMGYEISAIATTEADAVMAAERHKPDLMIVDLWLRDGSGLSAIDRILESGPMPHVIMNGVIGQLNRPGVVTLRKPFLEVELTGAIRRAIG